jgi:hypothetical protein
MAKPWSPGRLFRYPNYWSKGRFLCHNWDGICQMLITGLFDGKVKQLGNAVRFFRGTYEYH